jgi:hypothetical protein
MHPCSLHRISLCDRKLNLANSRLASWKKFEKMMDENTKDGELKEVILWIIKK